MSAKLMNNPCRKAPTCKLKEGAYRLPFAFQPLSYDQVTSRLAESLHLGIAPLLETVEEMLQELGNPDLHYRSLQVAGTNGKTSTSRYAASMLQALGYGTGLYTSPHLVRYPERMEVAGQVISDELFAVAVSAAWEAGTRVNRRREELGLKVYAITEFDTLTVAAAVAFALSGVEVAVLEVGMGGHWDATSAFKSIDTVAITGIGLDHMAILGPTEEAIAHEKAAVIKSGRKVVISGACAQKLQVFQVFCDQVQRTQTRPILVEAQAKEDLPGLSLPYAGFQLPEGWEQARYHILQQPAGSHRPLRLEVEGPGDTQALQLQAQKPAYQALNMAVAYVSVEAFAGGAISRTQAEAMAKAVAQTPVPGRFQQVWADPQVLVDAAHNPQSVQVCLSQLSQLENRDDLALLVSIFKDKDTSTMARQLTGAFHTIYVTQTHAARAMDADELVQVFEAAGVKPAGVFHSVDEALSELTQAGVALFCTGTISLAGEVTAWFTQSQAVL